MQLDETARPLVSLTTLQSGPTDHAVVIDFIKFSGQPSAGDPDIVLSALEHLDELRRTPQVRSMTAEPVPVYPVSPRAAAKSARRMPSLR